MGNNDIWIEFNNITKEFPGVKALDGVSFGIKKGEVLALCGENGAGKSTLINICSGLYKPDGGKVVVKGEEVHFRSARDAEDAKIATVHQEIPACLNMTIAENMFLGPKPPSKMPLLDRKYMNEHTRERLEVFGLTCSPGDKMGRLTLAEQSLINILKALDSEPEFLILDEPTSSLADAQKDILFAQIRKLREGSGVTVLYVSHRLEEVMEIADRVVVLKDGQFVNSKPISETSMDDIVRMMVGRDVEVANVYTERSVGDVAMKVTGLNRGRILRDVNFEVRRGEILGFSGFQGSGRTEILRAIVGLDKVNSINVEIEGKPVRIHRPEQAVQHGIAMISENRRDEGVIPNFDVEKNIIASSLKRVSNGLFINRSKTREQTQRYVDMMSIKLSSGKQLMMNLSGGNQQKVIIGRWLMSDPIVLLCDEPTRGIDVGAKSEIHSILMELANQGMAIVVVSSELPEIMTISDRILVMCEGRMTGELKRKEFSEEAIVALASDLSIGARAS
ncbi:MAG: sugar ABC transporter ATP-binding protein [Clostridiales Family XIII bacterium]|jgi:ribose transport system ATP-binding protein|nr:sugar ABC transporter ATP-binding protein [Clostridiales Family XIII bacterium]